MSMTNSRNNVKKQILQQLPSEVFTLFLIWIDEQNKKEGKDDIY